MESFSQQLSDSVMSYYESFVAQLPSVGVAFIVFLVLWTLSQWLSKLAGQAYRSRVEDQLLAKFLTRLTRALFFVIIFAIVLQILGLGKAASGLLAGAGIGAFVIGFAFKDIGENLLAGIMLAFNRPFDIGHTVEVDGVTGSVVALNLRNTRIKTFDGKDVFIPNSSMIKNKVTNFVLDGFLRQDFAIGLDYDEEIEDARKIIHQQLKNIPGILQDEKPPSVHLTAFDASSKALTVYYWIDTFDRRYSGLEIKTQAMSNCLFALSKAGYYMPGDILELKAYRGLESNIKVEKAS
ncbi:MAG: mechanosensitive ion channel family protein [Bacteroidota bacterium]